MQVHRQASDEIDCPSSKGEQFQLTHLHSRGPKRQPSVVY